MSSTIARNLSGRYTPYRNSLASWFSPEQGSGGTNSGLADEQDYDAMPLTVSNTPISAISDLYDTYNVLDWNGGLDISPISSSQLALLVYTVLCSAAFFTLINYLRTSMTCGNKMLFNDEADTGIDSASLALLLLFHAVSAAVLLWFVHITVGSAFTKSGVPWHVVCALVVFIVTCMYDLISVFAGAAAHKNAAVVECEKAKEQQERQQEQLEEESFAPFSEPVQPVEYLPPQQMSEEAQIIPPKQNYSTPDESMSSWQYATPLTAINDQQHRQSAPQDNYAGAFSLLSDHI